MPPPHTPCPDTPARWRCVAATPWLRPGDRAGRDDALATARFLRAGWRLPLDAPTSSARHTLSRELPAVGGVAELLRALHGRLVVVNHLPVATVPRATAALARGLTSGALGEWPDGPWPGAPWPAAPRGGSASWPRDSRAAHAHALAHAWLARHDPAGALLAHGGRTPAVALALLEGPMRVNAAGAPGEIGAAHAPDVRAWLAQRLPPPTLALPRVVATVPYRLAVLVSRALPAGAPGAPGADDVGSSLGTTLGDPDERAAWFGGRLLLPDPWVVAAMDADSRRRWARVTGRAGTADSYWYPDSWARHLEAGRTVGCLTPATVARSLPSGPRDAAVASRGRAAAYGPATERGVCVPPGYGLVDCVGTLGTAVVLL